MQKISCLHLRMEPNPVLQESNFLQWNFCKKAYEELTEEDTVTYYV